MQTRSKTIAVKPPVKQKLRKELRKRKRPKPTECPICSKNLESDDATMDSEMHIENCIALAQLQNIQTAKGDPHRVRLPPIDIDVDVENNTNTSFGSAQYTDRDLKPRKIIGLPVPFSDKISTLTSLAANTLTELQSIRSPLLPSLSTFLTKGIDPSKDNKTNCTFLLSVIANQQHQIVQASRCRVCLESAFKAPLVSTLCWHVLCEECWLSSLNYKRICPTCSTITSPECLRKIFL
jgi:hypothetical protein